MKRSYDKVYNELFSEFFKDLRLNNHYSMKYVSDKLDINYNTYVCYEKGTRGCPMSVFKNICTFYNVDFLTTIKQLDDEATRRLLNDKV